MDSKSDEELRRALERTEKAYQELTILNRALAHDLRAPIRNIQGFTQILLGKHAGQLSEEARGYLRRMEAAGRTMEQLIDALLRLVGLPREEASRVEVDLSSAAEAVAAALRRGDPARQAEFVIRPGLKASGDPKLIRELMENLMANAWKFTSRHPRARIEVGTTLHEGKQAYFVRDDGAGFNPLHAGKLFVPFQRLHGSEFPGIGAGLAIATRIVSLHGGRISAEGNVEKGATIFFTLRPDDEPPGTTD